MNAEKTTPSNIDQYIATFPPDVRALLEKVGRQFTQLLLKLMRP